MSGISLASSQFTDGNVLPNTHSVNTGGNTHLYASKQAGGKNQKQQKQQKKKQQSRKAKKQSRKSSRKSRQSRKN